MKKTVGIITFHASHNYGSMLQAYALQQTVLSMGFDCKIINLRTERQRKFYRDNFYNYGIKGKALTLLLKPHILFAMKKRYNHFEQFLSDKLILTQEYSTLEEIEEANLNFDYYISGSDQIWNTACFDFDWAYYLPFANAKRIAYAPSMGPMPESQVNATNGHRIANLIDKYDAVSVREQRTSDWIKKYTGNDYPILPDPTLLIEPMTWNELAGDKPLVNGKYIYFYAPWPNKRLFEKAAELAKSYGLKIVVSPMYDFITLGDYPKKGIFEYYIPTGPVEFLNLCKFATYLTGGSFHLMVFASMFRKPIYAIDVNNDSRICQFLKGVAELDDNSDIDLISNQVDYDNLHRIIEGRRRMAMQFLAEALA